MTHLVFLFTCLLRPRLALLVRLAVLLLLGAAPVLVFERLAVIVSTVVVIAGALALDALAGGGRGVEREVALGDFAVAEPVQCVL